MKTSICLFVAALIGFACGYTLGTHVAEGNRSFNLELHHGPQSIGVSGRLPASFTMPQQPPATPAPAPIAERQAPVRGAAVSDDDCPSFAMSCDGGAR